MTDVAGNPLAADYTWSFTTQALPPPPPTEGPGGPILVIGYSGNPFSRYYAEILRAEGLNAFEAIDISAVDRDRARPVRRGDPRRDAADRRPRSTMLTSWVNAGGNLIAMRPDPQLATLLGLTAAGTTLANAYLAIDTTPRAGPGHRRQTRSSSTARPTGTRSRPRRRPPSAVATLYSNATTATTNPAVTLRTVGSAGGEAAAFAFDLARSIVYTRQGNPAWAGDERDGISPDALGRPLLRRQERRPAARLGGPQQGRDPAGRRAAAARSRT